MFFLFLVSPAILVFQEDGIAPYASHPLSGTTRLSQKKVCLYSCTEQEHQGKPSHDSPPLPLPTHAHRPSGTQNVACRRACLFQCWHWMKNEPPWGASV